MRTPTDIWFYAPDTTAEAELRTWAYLELCATVGLGEGTGMVVADGQVRVKPRPPDAADDWPEGNVLVLARGDIDDGRTRDGGSVL